MNVPASSSSPNAETALRRLVDIMARLRDPDQGCAWDIKQTHETIAPYTIEEAYEVAEAIISGTTDDLRDELGDLLLQVIFQARIAEESGDFNFTDIADSISEKMLKRHPHVFGDTNYRSYEEQHQAWENIKEEERKSKNKTGILDDVATTLPAMTRALKLQKRAARVGFDWDNPNDVIDKIQEELDEVIQEMHALPSAQLEDEIGDLIFSVVNLARKMGIDPDQALASTNRKFTSRFRHLETQAEVAKTTLDQISLDQMEKWWGEAKSSN